MKTGLVIVGGLLLISSFGCAPRLAQTPLGSEEEVWQKHIKKSYPAWTPPQTIPPTVAGNVIMETSGDDKVTTETEEIVLQPEPNPVAQNDIITPIQATPAASKTYTVQKGDTLSAISVKMYSTSKEIGRIIDANPVIKDKNQIKPGMTLVIPAL
jgi:nucleoid-associated protein YgaU